MYYKTVTRYELYNEAWSKPLIHLCKKYNLSDNGLRKICHRNNIPTPPAGYWAKIQNKCEVGPIPPLEFSYIEKINILVKNTGISKIVPKQEDDDIPTTITVPDKLIQPHNITQQFVTHFENKKCSSDGFYKSYKKGFIEIKISNKSINRALCIIDTIFKKAEELNVKCSKKVFTYNSEDFTIILEEIPDKVIIPLTKEELAKRYSWQKHTTKTIYTPSGNLRLKLNGILECNSSIIQSFSDGKKQRIENMLDKFFVSIFKSADYNKKLRQQRIWNDMDRKREQRENAETSDFKYKREAQSKNLLEALEKWEKYNRIREFVLQIIRAAIKNPEQLKSINEFTAWAKWALEYSKSLNPIDKNLNKIMSTQHEYWGNYCSSFWD